MMGRTRAEPRDGDLVLLPYGAAILVRPIGRTTRRCCSTDSPA